MEITTSGQSMIFLWCALCGVVLAVIFDLFRISRRVFPTGEAAAVAEDILYWLIAAIVFFIFVLRINSGELRFYQFLGALLGIMAYLFTVSPFFIRSAVFVLELLLRAGRFLIRMLSVPVVFVLRLVKKPIYLVISLGRSRSRRFFQRAGLAVSHFGKFIRRI